MGMFVLYAVIGTALFIAGFAIGHKLGYGNGDDNEL